MLNVMAQTIFTATRAGTQPVRHEERLPVAAPPRRPDEAARGARPRRWFSFGRRAG